VSIPGIDTFGQEHSSQQRCVDMFPEGCPIGVKKALHCNLDAGQRRWASTVWGSGIESSDWRPKKGPACEAGACMLGAAR
jgi:hypothetical protein